MTVMFSHKTTEAWDALTIGIIEAGFRITATWAGKDRARRRSEHPRPGCRPLDYPTGVPSQDRPDRGELILGASRAASGCYCPRTPASTGAVRPAALGHLPGLFRSSLGSNLQQLAHSKRTRQPSTTQRPLHRNTQRCTTSSPARGLRCPPEANQQPVGPTIQATR